MMITKVVKSIIYNIKIKYALKWEAVLARLQVQFWLHRYRPNSNCRFLARDSIYAIARYMPSPVRPSVCLSVCPSHGWISQRWLKLASCNLHHRVAHDSSFLMLDLAAKFDREDRELGCRIREGYAYEKYSIFCQVPVLYSDSPGGATL